MHCGRVSNLLSAYIDRELAGSEMLMIRRHLEGCPGCAADLESLGRVKSLLSMAPPAEPSEDATTALMRRWALRQAQPSAPAPRRHWNWHWKWLSEGRRWQRYSLAVTAGCLALAVAGTALALRKPNYPDAVAANVLPEIYLYQSEERLPALSPRPEVWRAETFHRHLGPPHARPDVWWNSAGNHMYGMLVSESTTSPYGFGR
jgi:anti-sigma factor RsiW